MTVFSRFSVVAIGGVVGLGLASAAMAQEFRDSRTGKVWMPDLAQENDATSNPNNPANRAFDPKAQGTVVRGVVVQHPRAKLMGTVPFTAGPSVPIVQIDAPTLQAIPAKHWLTILYVTNNSANTVDVVLNCHFMNGPNMVEDVRVIVPPAGPGERLGIPVRGPQTDIFVDRSQCEIATPL
jgi:hypothetical protein